MKGVAPLAIYRFQPDSLIDSLQIRVNDTGSARAYLHAREGAEAEELHAIQAAITAHGWKTVPTLHDGEPTLEVRGFTKPDDALGLLASHGWTLGTPTVQAQPDDTPTVKEKRAARTLKFAGYSYNLGDLSYLFYTVGPYLEHRKTMSPSDKVFGKIDIASGIGYMAGSLALTRYGGRDQSQNTIRTAVQKIERYARKEGIVPQEDTALKQITTDKPKGLLDKIDIIGSRYPSEVLNSVYVFVGACISAVAFYRGTREIPNHLTGALRSEAIAKRNAFRNDVGLGLITGASAIAGLAIKEKKPVEGEPGRHGIIGGALDWIQEKPLRATGIGYMVATAFHARGTYKQFKAGSEKPIYLAGRAVFIASNIFSELMLTLSSKGHGTGVKPDESIDRTVISATAELLLRQPEEKRLQLADQMAGYIASPEVLGGKAEDVAERLIKHMRAMEKNPWLANVGQAAEHNAMAANDNLAEKPGTTISTGQSQGMLHEAAQAQARG